MIVVTTDTVEGRRIKRVVGMVKGNSVRAKIFVADILAGLKNVIGGEVSEYSGLLAQSREQALDRMIDSARQQGANAVVCVRMTTSSVMQGMAEIMAYGTAVELE